MQRYDAREDVALGKCINYLFSLHAQTPQIFTVASLRPANRHSGLTFQVCSIDVLIGNDSVTHESLCDDPTSMRFPKEKKKSKRAKEKFPSILNQILNSRFE